MKLPHILWRLAALAVLGALVGYLLSLRWPVGVEPEATVEAEGMPEASSEGEALTERAVPQSSPAEVIYPAGAIEGELVVHFTRRSDYDAYLKALVEAGLRPIGQIDGLLAVRIPEAAYGRLHPGSYGARLSFSSPVERPLPPRDIAPEALARLTAYGASAGMITRDAFSGRGEGVLVAVIDSGIGAHAQFDDVHLVQTNLAGGADGAGHGTSVASIIAGSEGIAPEAELFIVRALEDSGRGNSFHLAEGIVEAVDSGVAIINSSLGLYADSAVVRQAVQYAAQRGVLMVAAAGNDGYAGMPYPAAYPEVLAVKAVDGRGQHALLPNQSEAIDFAAPGVGILTAKEDEGTTLFSGTSAAAPFVTGSLAALMSGESALPPAQALAVLRSVLNDQGAPGTDPVYGAGVLDWDRIRERDTADVVDVALGDLYIPPDALPGTTTPVAITVQNRGTRWLSGARLEVFVGKGEPVEFTLGALSPGQTTTREVFAALPSATSADVLELAARVSAHGREADVRLNNNVKAIRLGQKPADTD
jgi:hypothetical protein